LSNEHITAIFSNIDILYNFCKELVHLLNERMKSWTAQSKLGDIFLRLAPFLKSYSEYTKNYDSARVLLGRLQASHPKFRAFIANRKSIQTSKNLDLPSLLIMPVQRLPRVILLLQELKKNTPDNHPDSAPLNKAIDIVKNVVDSMNNTIKAAENTSKILSIQQNFGDNFVLLAPARFFLREGPVVIVNVVANKRANGYMFLFNDMMLLSRRAMLYNNLILDAQIYLVSATVSDADSCSFCVSPKCKLVFANPEEKMSWLMDISKAIDLVRERDAEAVKIQMAKKSKQISQEAPPPKTQSAEARADKERAKTRSLSF
jgi:hypothetical protein